MQRRSWRSSNLSHLLTFEASLVMIKDMSGLANLLNHNARMRMREAELWSSPVLSSSLSVAWFSGNAFELAFLYIGELTVKVNKLLCIRSHVKLANRNRLITDYAVMATEDAAALFPAPDGCFRLQIHKVPKTVPEWGMELDRTAQR